MRLYMVLAIIAASGVALNHAFPISRPPYFTKDFKNCVGLTHCAAVVSSSLLTLIILVDILGFAKASTVKQVFPEDVDYSCYSPNIKLMCTFPEGAFDVFWTVSNGSHPGIVDSSTPGHTVDSSALQSGVSFLVVKHTKYSMGNIYSCTAVYNRSADCSDPSAPFPVPMVEDPTAQIYNLSTTSIQDALHVWWNHDYYLCRNFTIFLNNTVVPKCTNITALHCTIQYPDDGILVVKVVATEFGIQSIQISDIVDTNAAFCSAFPGYHIWMPLATLMLMCFAYD